MPRSFATPNLNTITVESQGGIGNQLFIYAFARELQLRSELPVSLDLWRHHLPNARPFQIGELVGNQVGIVNTWRNSPQTIGPMWNRFRGKVQRLSTSLPSARIIYETSLSYDPRYFRAAPGSRLIGYFQSWRYFAQTADSLRRGLLAKRAESKRPDRQASTSEKVAIHLRLGDFLHRRHRRTHAQLTNEYYRQAIRMVSASASDATFVVFSDEPELAQQILSRFLPTLKAETYKSGSSDLEDLFEMSEFDFIISANSSFGWWSAWLSGLPGERIVVPRNWVNRSDFTIEDLVPRSWTVLP